ncbi:hypothetical protein C6H66_15990 [Photorhabdus hindustanensis]|uniref:Uncharacterized protein n=1 Tax=Photorhabdus hindustanensis TaxID=2918802 RepID=A0A2S8PYT8_9GAMM|nr:hypothetical protein C6H66_15990 [Photorhabdus hindustanensis]
MLLLTAKCLYANQTSDFKQISRKKQLTHLADIRIMRPATPMKVMQKDGYVAQLVRAQHS